MRFSLLAASALAATSVAINPRHFKRDNDELHMERAAAETTTKTKEPPHTTKPKVTTSALPRVVNGLRVPSASNLAKLTSVKSKSSKPATSKAKPTASTSQHFHSDTLQSIKTTSSAGAKCTAGDTSSTTGVQSILESTGAIDWLDVMLTILPKRENDWVNQLWLTVFPNEGASPLSGCGEIGSDCRIDGLCTDYSSVMAYWTFQSVAALHSKMNTIHGKLLWFGWLDGLSIDQIAKDFASPPPDLTWMKWVSAALSMAGSTVGAGEIGGPLSGMLGFASAGMSAATIPGAGGDTVDTTSVENTLRNIVGAAGAYVAQILSNATGNGISDTLPIYTQSTDETGTGRFFSDSSILLDQNKDNSSFFAAYDVFTKNIEKKLVDVALKTAWYVLVGEENSQASDCTMPGGFFLPARNGESRCFYLSRPGDSSACRNNDPSTCIFDAWQSPNYGMNKMDNGVYTKLTDTYGFDLKAYYVSLIDCALNGNGEVDTGHTTNNGQIPRCFYNGFVRSGDWTGDSDGSSVLDLVLSNL